MAKANSKLAKAWLRRHAAGEKKLAGVLTRYFAAQTKRIVAALADFNAPSPAIVPQIFRPDDEHVLLMQAIGEPLLSMMATGAVETLASRPKSKKEFDVDAAGFLEDFELPQRMRDAIASAFIDLGKRDYWRELQEATGDALTKVLQAAIEEGVTEREMAKRVKGAMGDIAGWRAKAIARTEVTGAFNAGHDATYREIADEIAGIKWLAILDDRVRETHAALNGEVIAPNGAFSLGGVEVRFPGSPELPAEERINCRCTTAAVFDV